MCALWRIIDFPVMHQAGRSHHQIHSDLIVEWI